MNCKAAYKHVILLYELRHFSCAADDAVVRADRLCPPN